MTSTRQKKRFQPGDRVVLEGNWEFEDGIVGTVTRPPRGLLALTGPDEWEGNRRTFPGKNGPIHSYFVVFDEPHDDGSGDGPYGGSEIDEDSLRPLLSLVTDA
jgi:hypothetical protein